MIQFTASVDQFPNVLGFFCRGESRSAPTIIYDDDTMQMVRHNDEYIRLNMTVLFS